VCCADARRAAEAVAKSTKKHTSVGEVKAPGVRSCSGYTTTTANGTAFASFVQLMNRSALQSEPVVHATGDCQ
jgi:hypothetical protein